MTGRLMADLLNFRSVAIQGHVGSGKTALAVELALRLVVEGYAPRIVSNVPLAFESSGTVKVSDLASTEDAAIIVDEAWVYLEAGNFKSAKQFVAMPRHLNQFLIFPSATNLTSYVKWLEVKLRFNFMPFGIPAWWFAVDREPKDGKFKPDYHFVWWRPDSVFGLYQRYYKKGSFTPDTFHVYEIA